AAVVLGKDIQLADFGDERLCHFHLADDLSKATISDIDVLVFDLLELQPALRGQRGQPHVDGEKNGQQNRQRPVIKSSDRQNCDDLNDHRKEIIGKRLQELGDEHD